MENDINFVDISHHILHMIFLAELDERIEEFKNLISLNLNEKLYNILLNYGSIEFLQCIIPKYINYNFIHFKNEINFIYLLIKANYVSLLEEKLEENCDKTLIMDYFHKACFNSSYDVIEFLQKKFQIMSPDMTQIEKFIIFSVKSFSFASKMCNSYIGALPTGRFDIIEIICRSNNPQTISFLQEYVSCAHEKVYTCIKKYNAYRVYQQFSEFLFATIFEGICIISYNNNNFSHLLFSNLVFELKKNYLLFPHSLFIGRIFMNMNVSTSTHRESNRRYDMLSKSIDIIYNNIEQKKESIPEVPLIGMAFGGSTSILLIPAIENILETLPWVCLSITK